MTTTSPFLKALLHRKTDGYTHYVIIPHFIYGGNNAFEGVNTLDKGKLILLDKLMEKVTSDFGAAYEDFEAAIFEALKQVLSRLVEYSTLKIIFPRHSYFPKEILTGFLNFCDRYEFIRSIVHDIGEESITRGDVYTSLMEEDLVTPVEKVLATNLTVGRDVGVISYNETPLKKIILEGITTISSDFSFMGRKTAELIMTNSRERSKCLPAKRSVLRYSRYENRFYLHQINDLDSHTSISDFRIITKGNYL